MNHLLILGSTSDIAQAIAKKYVSEGWSITLAARNLESLDAIASDLRIRSEAEINTCAFDATATDTHLAFYQSLDSAPDAVISVFGYMGDQIEARTNWGEAERTLAVNFTGAVSIFNIIANDFEQRGSGMIAGVSSVAGDRGRQSNYIYGCAKAGFTAYLSGLRNRLEKSDVQVMTIKPGFCRTKMTESLDLPVALTAEPAQVAQAVFKGHQNKRNVIYSLWMWRWVMIIIRLIPEFIFKKLSM